MDVTLKKITEHNYEAVAELYIPDEQQKLLSENIWSIAESKFHDNYHPHAIYNDEKLVGFIMWVNVSYTMSSIWRFMVAHEFQGKGIGRKALQLAIEEMKCRVGIEIIEICYGPENTAAKSLYFSSGFTEVRLSDCGTEAYAQIDVAVSKMSAQAHAPEPLTANFKPGVKLVEITRDNFEAVVALELEEAQKEFIPSNVYSIAQSMYSIYSHLNRLRAICMDEKMVGFVIYQYGEIGEFDEKECTIWCFMVDRRHQNTGIGKAAMSLLLEEIKSNSDRCNLVDIYYKPNNIIAQKLYSSLGFKEVGDRDDGTIIAERSF